METSLTTQTSGNTLGSHQEAWAMALNQLRQELTRTQFENWVLPLEPVQPSPGVFCLAAANSYGRDWVENRLKSRLTRMLGGLLNEPVQVELVLKESQPAAPDLSEEDDDLSAQDEGQKNGKTAGSRRKMMLQRAYGSDRARVIQPERGMFVTHYFFNQWLPLLGASAANVILAARSMCYWNPMTGELRNQLETEMGELAYRAAVSVRTVKDVLNQELIKRYFIRYKVRRVMTSNGVRTAGISLEVRMDDPLTPADQQNNGLSENEDWFTLDIED